MVCHCVYHIIGSRVPSQQSGFELTDQYIELIYYKLLINYQHKPKSLISANHDYRVYSKIVKFAKDVFEVKNKATCFVRGLLQPPKHSCRSLRRYTEKIEKFKYKRAQCRARGGIDQSLLDAIKTAPHDQIKSIVEDYSSESRELSGSDPSAATITNPSDISETNIASTSSNNDDDDVDVVNVGSRSRGVKRRLSSGQSSPRMLQGRRQPTAREEVLHQASTREPDSRNAGAVTMSRRPRVSIQSSRREPRVRIKRTPRRRV